MCVYCEERLAAQQRLMLALDKLAQVHNTRKNRWYSTMLLKGQIRKKYAARENCDKLWYPSMWVKTQENWGA